MDNPEKLNPIESIMKAMKNSTTWVAIPVILRFSPLKLPSIPVDKISAGPNCASP